MSRDSGHAANEMPEIQAETSSGWSHKRSVDAANSWNISKSALFQNGRENKNIQRKFAVSFFFQLKSSASKLRNPVEPGKDR